VLPSSLYLESNSTIPSTPHPCYLNATNFLWFVPTSKNCGEKKEKERRKEYSYTTFDHRGPFFQFLWIWIRIHFFFFFFTFYAVPATVTVTTALAWVQLAGEISFSGQDHGENWKPKCPPTVQILEAFPFLVLKSTREFVLEFVAVGICCTVSGFWLLLA
jgi:hypothetical protein